MCRIMTAVRSPSPVFAYAWTSAIRNIVGTFVYHCHLLEHEDKGMMGSIQVIAALVKRTG